MDCNLINFLMLENYRTKLRVLEKRIYQLIIARLDGENIYSADYQEKIIELVKKGIGGLIIFGGRKDEIKNFINKVQSVSEISLFIASDIECGVGQQLKDATLFPCQMAMAAAIDRDRPEDVRLLRSTIKAMADESIDVGINMPLIPVLDVNQNPENPIICTRAFSDNPEDVAWFGSEYIRLLEGSGLISCGKHFPGHGDTAIDSHISLPVINKSLKDLIKTDLKPFIEAIKAGISSIMVGHLSIPAIDSKPASLSKRIIIDLLRKELGFDGLILTDALNMNALKDIKDSPIECINAGVDILLHPVDADMTAKELLSGFERHVITEERIDDAVNRILRMKAEIQDIKRVDVDYQEHEILSQQITEMSITLVKDKIGLLPLSDASRIHIVFAGDNRFHESSLLKNYFKNTSVIRETKNMRGDAAVFAIFTGIATGKGSSGIDEMERYRITELMKKFKNSIVISFGSPYVLRHFMEADVLIAAYDAAETSQEAVLRCLKGEVEAKGHIPVTIGHPSQGRSL